MSNRKIKFRAYSHLYKNIWEVVNLYDLDKGNPLTGNVTFVGNEGDVWDATFDGNGFTLMQCVGLTDINGKDLYEGDIVKDELLGRVFKVVYMHCRHKFEAITPTNFVYTDFFDWLVGEADDLHGSHYTKLNVKIIGNIYETPQLLKIKK